MSRDEHHTVIATAGHVDHGKTALVRRLTGRDTDRLPDEKRRGISIELGFAELPDAPVSLIDVPGHRALVHTMIAGMGGVSAALLVVAADDGVMPQTWEHLHVCQLLGVEHVLVALSKCDLVDDETLELAQDDVAEALAAAGLTARRVIPTSAVTGQGVHELHAALLELHRQMQPRSVSERVWLPVDRVFSVRGAGTVVTGTLTRGRVSVGQTLLVKGSQATLRATARALQIHDTPVSCAVAPARVALNLAGIAREALQRGDVVTSDREAELEPSQRLDVTISPLAGVRDELRDNATVSVHFGTCHCSGRIVHLGAGVAHLHLETPIPAAAGIGFVLRGFRSDPTRGAVLAGGKILDAAAAPLPRRRDKDARAMRAEQLQALSRGDAAAALTLALQAAVPRALDAAPLEDRFGLEPGATARLLHDGDACISFGSSWAHRAALTRLSQLIRELCARHHREQPEQAGISVETLRAELSRRAGRELATHVVQEATRDRVLVEVEPGLVALAEFAARSGPALDRLAIELLPALQARGLGGATLDDLSDAVSSSLDTVKAVLGRVSRDSPERPPLARRLGELWFAESALERLRDQVVAHFSTHASLSVGELKSLADVSRKQAIPLLEQLDREGTTRRQGDQRVLGARGQRRAGSAR